MSKERCKASLPTTSISFKLREIWEESVIQRANVLAWGPSVVLKADKPASNPPKEKYPQKDKRKIDQQPKIPRGGGGDQFEKTKRMKEDQTQDLSGPAPADAVPFPIRKKGLCPGCGSTCFLGGHNKPPKCVQHAFAGAHPAANPKAYGQPKDRVTWQQHCFDTSMDPTQALQFGSFLDTKKTVHKYTPTLGQYLKYKQALEAEVKGEPHPYHNQQTEKIVLDSTTRSQTNDFCCLEALCSIEHASTDPSDFAHQLYCQPINIPNVVRRGSNLCSVYLYPILPQLPQLQKEPGRTDQIWEEPQPRYR